MSWISDGWAWYTANSAQLNPILAFLGGAPLVWAAIRQARTATNRHHEQTRADQQRRLTESFSKAVEQLANDKIEARLGGIYTLERLAIEAIAQAGSRRRLVRLRPRRRDRPDQVSDLYWTVMETLTAFVRERSKRPIVVPGEAEGPEFDLARPATDISAVMSVIRRRPAIGRARESQRDWFLDLRATFLRGADLAGAELRRASLFRSDLREAMLHRADFSGAELIGVDLSDANLSDANLSDANLQMANLVEANLLTADLRSITLERANLSGADLRGAYLTGAFLRGANLSGADLRGALHLDQLQLDEACGNNVKLDPPLTIEPCP